MNFCPIRGCKIPLPDSPGGKAAGDANHRGGARTGYGRLAERPLLMTLPAPATCGVDYVLPSRDLRVIDAGVLWPVTPTRGRLRQHASDRFGVTVEDPIA